jgi:hypothetical protein
MSFTLKTGYPRSSIHRWKSSSEQSKATLENNNLVVMSTPVREAFDATYIDPL